MAYAVKEIFYTLQGEGMNAGRPAVFLRFAGCNLWSGRAEDRGRGLGGCSAWCDTDFVGVNGTNGGKYTSAAVLADRVASLWPSPGGERFVVCTGGEPLLQLDVELVDALHQLGFEIAVETNGTQPLPAPIDWVCVSPKSGAPVVLERGDELKLVYPQAGLDPEAFRGLAFDHFLLQPLDGPAAAENTRAVLRYCLDHPWWRLGVQTHKVLGIP
ncbi:MAG TPA: 7-carboxy-7-deazaguanine synthase [Kofleriaceae bacterium]|nr:7-carboxy-7-deazaguanine synthase [Kofleriaceae bacterium]